MKDIILTASLLILPYISGPLQAQVQLGYDGAPSSFIFSAFDPTTGATYYRNLALNFTAFLQSPSGQINLATDPSFAPWVGKTSIQYNVTAFSPLREDASNTESWGVLLTLPQGASGIECSWISIDALRQTLQIFYTYLTEDSGVIEKNAPGGFGSLQWSADLLGKLPGSSLQTPGNAAPFYYLTNATGNPSGGLIRKAGEWTLGLDGWLKLSNGHSLLQNQIPIANAGATQSVLIGKPVTLSGVKSNDPDESPSPLSYRWVQTSGPSVTLTSTGAQTTGFTASTLSTYTFQLTVSDGKDQSSSAVSVDTTAFKMTAGSSYKRLGKANTPVKWSYAESWVKATDLVSLRYSTDGSHWIRISASPLLAKKGGYDWKPKANMALGSGFLQACVTSSLRKATYCDSTPVSISK